MTSADDWGPLRRIGFRFGFLLGVLVAWPFPLDAIPKLDWLTKSLSWPLTELNHWFGSAVFGLPPPYLGPNGSGDTSYDYVMQLTTVILAAAGTILWSILDRRRRAYPRLAAVLRVELRYTLAYAMLSYGFAKITKSQFPDLPPTWLHQQMGDNSPMRMLWAFMGYSTPYTVFAGSLEALGGVLLLWRRTTVAGALVVIAVMANVVMLNFCYDVPVKIYSTQLLVIAVAIAWPGLRRLVAAVLGHAVPEVPPRVRLSRRLERARIVAKLIMLGLLGYMVYQQLAADSRNDRGHELYGSWAVDTFSADGVELAPLASDPVRWQAWTVHPRSAAIWRMNGEREARDTDYFRGYPIKVDAAAHTITVTIDDKKKLSETWTYTRPAPDRLTIDGAHGGKQLHVALHLEPESRLLSRGFHWINEAPYNR